MTRIHHYLFLAAVATAIFFGAAANAANGLDSLNAGVNWGDGKAYFFGTTEDLGLAYVRYDIKADKVDPGYPKQVNDRTWPGLGKMTAILAALNWGNGKVYFFGHYDDSGEVFYVRYDIRSDKADKGYPKPLTEKNWRGVNSIEFLSGAVNWGNGLTYFFGDDENQNSVYLTYDNAKDRAVQKKPVPMNNSTWPGLGFSGISTGVDWGNGKVYVFGYMKQSDVLYYARFDKKTNRVEKGYPKRVTQNLWPGLLRQK